MGALCWKKGKEILTNKIKLVVSLFLPVLVFGWIVYNKNTMENIFFIFPLVSILLFWLVMFSIEDYIYTEAILGTNVTLKDVWVSNLFLTTFVGFFYSLVLSIIYLVFTNQMHVIFEIGFLVNMMSGLIIGGGLVAFSTFYISNYSKLRQTISSIGSIGSLALLVVLLLTDQKMIILENKSLLVMILAVTGLLSFVVVDKYSSPEAFLCNIKKLGQVYEDKQTTDE
ncbi:hypothetical protein acsn021_02970 [Anaerocolumna cellulosilytica]|uniref:Uncharacterized protein n=1 Tax=Anaerocolumna cellulosilytica TaxID=433286 RepID=A0A6S6R169_9FIRM|nr:hypothetical protein [Anaerocolumna cellulosilytica]MBB5196871.1 hypothetical protein [Anaerocolumna cellulosilytica]BCJ92728.1 hypothetical protein acsn021_02970 [Anaerocolumna cellulosilytica]